MIKPQLILFIFIFIPIFGFPQSFKIIENDTINRITVDSVKQGLWREYYTTTGNIKSEVYYVNGKKDGLEIVWYNIPHCIQYEANYKLGELDGAMYQYSRWCNLEKEENFKNGKAWGYQRSFFSNGRIKSEGNFKEDKLIGYYKVYDKEGDLLYESKSDATELVLKDSAVLNGSKTALDRILNPNTNQSDKLIVTDVTGSMYPYAKQLISWYENYVAINKSPLNFIFFNDGDKKPQELKTLGNAGGIYHVSSDDLSEIVRVMSKATSNGGGGDAAENNAEAVIAGITKFPKTKQVIMIADNTAPVRDIEIAKRIKKPVKIILCGYLPQDEVNIDFILMAYLTKGSLHTFEADLYDFSETSTNKVIEIQGYNYVIGNGRVIKL